MGLQVQRPELIDAEHDRRIIRARGGAVGDRVQLPHPGGLGLVVRIGAGLEGRHRLKADVLLTQEQAEALVGDVVDHPLGDEEVGEFRQAPDRERRIVIVRAAQRVRYERQRPGELVHMDVKKIGRIPGGGGWRAHGPRCPRGDPGPDDQGRLRALDGGRPLPAGVLRDPARREGHHLRGLPGPRRGLLRRSWHHDHGITRIERVMTDNAWAYRWSLRAVITALGVRQVFIKPHCSWQNGKVERLNRTLATEWAYRQVFTSNTDRADAFAPWIEHYNTRRRHSALGRLPPLSRLSST
jgi:transposase InsO family protein